MTEPTIICPNCKTEIKLTESLAAPLLAATKQDFDKRLAQKDAEIGAIGGAVARQVGTGRAPGREEGAQIATVDASVAIEVAGRARGLDHARLHPFTNGAAY